MAKISVVIPTLNEEKWLPGILSDMCSQHLMPHEIIVVDGGSQDKTLEIAREHGAKVVVCEKSIPLARNVGAQEASGEIVAYFDADVRVPRDFLQKSAAEFDRHGLGIACPNFSARGCGIASEAIFGFFNMWFVMLQWVLPSGGGMCMMVRKSLFQETGGFDEGAKFEDIEFIRRGGRAGRFRMLSSTALVSDRRFRKEGTIRTTAKYLALSVFFIFGQFRAANIIDYGFGSY